MHTLKVSYSAARPVLIESQTPIPQPGPGELLIRIHAAGLTPTELRWYPTSHTIQGAHRTGAVPGHEFSGVVVALGSQVGGLELHQHVLGMNDWYSEGAMAEYCVAPYHAVIRKPEALTHVQAATIPIGALTAWQGLFERGKLQAGQKVLIHGGAGAVGIFAIQLAKLAGAHVSTTVSARHMDLAASLGADEVIDYRGERFENKVRGMHLIFDTVGGEILCRSWPLLLPEGKMVTVASNSEVEADDRTRAAFFIVEPNQKQLTAICGMIERGKIQPVVDSVIPLRRAPEAFQPGFERRGCGKLVVAVAVS